VARPLVIAYHIVWTAYGWWLPNDPRGSMSRKVRKPAIGGLGDPYYGRRAIQPPARAVRQFYARAREALAFPLLEIGSAERALVGDAVAETVAARRYTCYVCAILPDHVHLVVRKHRDKAEQMIAALQDASRLRLRRAGLRAPDHPVWSVGGWKRFLGRPEDVRSAIAYIEGNPAERGLPPQAWPFAVPYDGWPLHPGHNPRSPYTRRLRGTSDER